MSSVSLEQIKNTLRTYGKYWIVFTGDSITSCEWVHPNWREIVIYVLQRELVDLMDGDWKIPDWGIRGFNFAYDGATTKDILDKIDDILLVKPKLVICLMGGNDPVLGVSVEESVENITEVCELVTKVGSQLVWCSSTPAGKGSKKNLEYEPYAEAFMQTPIKENFFKVDMFNIYQKYPVEKFFTFVSEENPVEGIKAGDLDLQHPNQLGNSYIAKIILKEVFGINFDAEMYIKETFEGRKHPSYS